MYTQSDEVTPRHDLDTFSWEPSALYPLNLCLVLLDAHCSDPSNTNGFQSSVLLQGIANLKDF